MIRLGNGNGVSFWHAFWLQERLRWTSNLELKRVL
jgi:hypothetical protein